MRLALADALHFRGMQAIDLSVALMLPLLKNPRRQMQRPAEDGLEFVLVGDLPRNIPDGAPEIGLELAKGLAGALELVGVGVTLIRSPPILSARGQARRLSITSPALVCSCRS